MVNRQSNIPHIFAEIQIFAVADSARRGVKIIGLIPLGNAMHGISLGKFLWRVAAIQAGFIETQFAAVRQGDSVRAAVCETDD